MILDTQEAEIEMGQKGQVWATSYSIVKRHGSWSHGSMVKNTSDDVGSVPHMAAQSCL